LTATFERLRAQVQAMCGHLVQPGGFR